jgi:hypothetical protein
MISFLAARPVRLSNILGLKIGTSFLEVAEGYDISIPAFETKTNICIEFPAPAALGLHLRRYLNHYRKILQLGPLGVRAGYIDQADYLWLARSGRQLPVATFEDITAKLSIERFGVRLTPHNFRHCAATAIAEYSPEDYHIIRLILGHTSNETAEKYYTQAKGREAARAHQNNIQAIRKDSVGKEGQQRVAPSAEYDMSMDFGGHTEKYKRAFMR